MGTANRFKQLINGDEPVLVDFYADWCGPCRYQAPILKEVADRTKGKARVVKVDVDKNPDISLQLGIKGIPTLMIFHKGKIVWRVSGVRQADELIERLQAVST